MKPSVQPIYLVGIVYLALVLALLPSPDLARFVIMVASGSVSICNPCSF